MHTDRSTIPNDHVGDLQDPESNTVEGDPAVGTHLIGFHELPSAVRTHGNATHTTEVFEPISIHSFPLREAAEEFANQKVTACNRRTSENNSLGRISCNRRLEGS